MKDVCESDREAGFSLVELLVSAGLGTLVLSMALALAMGHGRSMVGLRAEAQALADIHWSMQQVAADLAAAGIDPQRVVFPEPLRMGAHGFSRIADLNGDGEVDRRSREFVTLLVSSRGALIRSVGRQLMALLEGVMPQGFVLRAMERSGRRSNREFSGENSGENNDGITDGTTDGTVARVTFSIETARGGKFSSSTALRWTGASVWAGRSGSARAAGLPPISDHPELSDAGEVAG